MEGYFSETNKVKDTTLSTAPLISPPPPFFVRLFCSRIRAKEHEKGKNKKDKKKVVRK